MRSLYLVPISGLFSGIFLIPFTFAGANLKISDETSMNIGGSIRAYYQDTDDEKTSNFHSIRFYIKGNVTDKVGFKIETEGKGGDMGVLDAVAKIKISDNNQIWAGRFIGPSDRANLSGSYNISSWDYPGLTSAYKTLKGGRDNGIALIGSNDNGKLSYSIGYMNGEGYDTEDYDPEDGLVSARIAYSFWDKEGYLTRSTYFGSKDVFTVGLTTMKMDDAFASGSDFSMTMADILIEKNLSNGSVGTFEAAFYDYDKFSANTGDAYKLGLSYMPPGEIGLGRLQLVARYQEFSPDNNIETTRTDLGLTSVMKGHNARVGLYYQETDNGVAKTDSIKIGMQLKI